MPSVGALDCNAVFARTSGALSVSSPTWVAMASACLVPPNRSMIAFISIQPSFSASLHSIPCSLHAAHHDVSSSSSSPILRFQRRRRKVAMLAHNTASPARVLSRVLFNISLDRMIPTTTLQSPYLPTRSLWHVPRSTSVPDYQPSLLRVWPLEGKSRLQATRRNSLG